VRVALRVLAVLVALFLAYVLGRAIGILLDINPWVTEAVAIAAFLIGLTMLALRRRGATRART
jgi:hypothetical protein